jgi:RNA polymerase sigma-70 factor (ECF subfamily)
MSELPEENPSDSQQDQETQKLARTPESENQLRAWLDCIVDGDQNALGLLYDCLVHQVYGLCLRMLKQPALAEEVVQDTFWQVWRQAPRFDPERGSVKAWVMTIARSRTLDALRATEAQREMEVHSADTEVDILELIVAPTANMPPNLLASEQEDQQLQALLAKLEPVARQLVYLAFFRGLSHEEIAAGSGLPLGTVKSHIRRALQTLRELLNRAVTSHE